MKAVIKNFNFWKIGGCW